MLNLIAGATAPTAGTILLDGRDITHMPPRDRGIGMVFQNYALMPHMSVFDNVAYPLRVRHQSARTIREKVTEALECVGLRGFEDRKPRQLSGGQQQRVGIARCIVYSPAIIMMDEPLGALDKNLREQMQGEIKRLHKDLGTTFIYVTHDQEEALNMSDRICLMSAGQIAQVGTPDELYFRPRTRFVAEFIGESNLISGRINGAGLMMIAGGKSITVPGDTLTEGSELLVLVRPEKNANLRHRPASRRRQQRPQWKGCEQLLLRRHDPRYRRHRERPKDYGQACIRPFRVTTGAGHERSALLVTVRRSSSREMMLPHSPLTGHAPGMQRAYIFLPKVT
ncbi:hypothetical protein AOQ72_16605 [Bradyrhizobium yuanmingense]|uniref:ABC transporter domain-containing protein n=1 Tax=Bradyrhizobium yuanmingense TaxID=108015 RepID=A0A0R3CLW8_9BRAD|nr:ABC transporter ATP-binding protein [Bradyrhizobium yuanmingense]KRP98735.1 hypothetical protein AOQ72_16605 [Bradyrhizobium yuanmingense]